jgi:putative nucleotidyltransferase with HDIG domain
MLLLGAAALSWSVLHWPADDRLRFFSYLFSAIIAAVLKVRLPGVSGAASVSFLFLLIGIVDLSPAEATVMAAAAMLVQCAYSRGRTSLYQTLFSVANLSAAVAASASIYSQARAVLPEPAALAVLAIAYYVTNTLAVACIIALTESKSFAAIARGSLWLVPYYGCATSMAWMIGAMPTNIQWELPIICLPIVYVVHRSHRTLLAQVEKEKAHVEEVNRVHMRTIEALALAIDAKDHTTHDHLERVQLYALEIGKELGLGAAQLDALRAASVLHDIGKLAVPEHIISKPGKLTPAEFQKMKIHPVVGAEILERVSFPYPVTPMVRSHHEKWDGSGYPDGLKGEEIPIGARILSVVDCFDALASDRQYRRALPIDEAMAKVAAESGTSFDPAVVEVLRRRYRELETKAEALRSHSPALSTDICITRGAAPAAGFATEVPPASVVAAIRPARAHAAEPGAGLETLSAEEALAVLAVRVKSAVPCDAFAAWLKKGGSLQAAYVAGIDSAGLVDDRILNWVAETGSAIVNASPDADPGYAGPLRSAIAVPLQSYGGVVGVVAAYRRERDAFSSDEAMVLSSLCRPFAVALNGSRNAEGSRGELAIAV